MVSTIHAITLIVFKIFQILQISYMLIYWSSRISFAIISIKLEPMCMLWLVSVYEKVTSDGIGLKLQS